VAAERKEKEDMMDDVTGGGSDERATGTPNTIYDLSSVLFHALEGGASYDTYIEDAEREGDEELAEFFRRVRDEDSMRADEAQRLLAERTPTAAIEDTTSPAIGGAEGAATSMAGGAAAGASSRTEPSGAPPDTTEELPSTRAEAPPGKGISPRTEPSSAREGMEETPRASGIEERPLSRTQGTPPLEPETPDDLPGTEPIRGKDVLTDRAEEVPPPPEEVPPERAGEIPMAEEVPPPRTEEVPRVEEIPSGTPPHAPPGDVQRETSPESPSRAEEAPPPDRGRAEAREEKGLLDRAMDALRGREEEPRRGSSGDEPPAGR
jgi:rubrerythrin